MVFINAARNLRYDIICGMLMLQNYVLDRYTILTSRKIEVNHDFLSIVVSVQLLHENNISNNFTINNKTM